MEAEKEVSFCVNCGKYLTSFMAQELPEFKEYSLKNYNRFKDIQVFKCSNCDYCSENIFDVKGLEICHRTEDTNYKNIYNYAYLNKLNEVFIENTLSVPANIYEAYSYLCLQNNYNISKAIRALYKTVYFKNMLKRKYNLAKDEFSAEEDNESIYIELEKLLNSSIKYNIKQIIELVEKNIDNLNAFDICVGIECLCVIKRKQRANELLDKIQNVINKDLKEYLIALILKEK